jgi:hypothetical protein
MTSLRHTIGSHGIRYGGELAGQPRVALSTVAATERNGLFASSSTTASTGSSTSEVSMLT